MNSKKLICQHLKTIFFIIFVFLILFSCSQQKEDNNSITQTSSNKTIINEVFRHSEKEIGYDQLTSKNFSDYNIPVYFNEPFVTLNNNIPWFNDSDKTANAFEKYSTLDSYGRCGAAFVCVCTETMSTEERGEIGSIKPSGWHTVKYDAVDGKYLYNRCHLVAYKLCGENANPQNLITGTRYLNVEGMLPFENRVCEYVKSTRNHVLYRVTPVYEKNNLLANGVIIEAYSIEDNGEGICFNVFCYNVQPGIEINYLTGESQLTTPSTKTNTIQNISNNIKYVINKNTDKFHNPNCPSVQDMKEKNKIYFNGTREELIETGYMPCKRCNP